MRTVTKSVLVLFRHLDRTGQELFRDSAEFGKQLSLLRGMVRDGWITLEVWPPDPRISPIAAAPRDEVRDASGHDVRGY